MENAAILLVEDNTEEVELTLRALRQNNNRRQVFVVHDGVEALDFLFCRNTYVDRNPYELPRLILLDLKLPILDGLEVLRQIRAGQRTRLLPVVVLTSSKEEQDLIESYKNGANSYIRKSINFAEFVEAMGQLDSYWLGLNEEPPG